MYDEMGTYCEPRRPVKPSHRPPHSPQLENICSPEPPRWAGRVPEPASARGQTGIRNAKLMHRTTNEQKYICISPASFLDPLYDRYSVFRKVVRPASNAIAKYFGRTSLTNLAKLSIIFAKGVWTSPSPLPLGPFTTWKEV